ncbi:hypothetical protein NC652_029142 [Populus alba x Populus x berolinensis]|nr:hypothetical protein NC652_029142 [Populus alba x Populus x berolinensis]
MPWFGGYVGNWFNGYFGAGRAMAELRWAVVVFIIFLEGDENCQGRWFAVAVRGKNSNHDLEEARDRRRLKLSSLTGKLKVLEDCTATPNPDCGCSRVSLQTLIAIEIVKPMIAGVKATEKLSEKSRPKTMRSNRDLVCLRLSIQNK